MRWWRSRGQAARLDLWIRSSFYANFAAVPILAGGSVGLDFGGAAPWMAAALAAVPSLACLLLMHAGIDHYLGKRARPTRLIAAAGTLTVLGVMVAFLVYPKPTPGHPDSPANAILLILVVSFLIALGVAVRPPVTLAVGAVGCAATFAISIVQGASNPAGPTFALANLILVVVLACRGSLWMLSVVWELDRSRQVQASLAVAEERLRFARDLHDVVGRTLSAVALKAELAAQLAKRGRDEAVDEMLDVRRIAQESLAELRAVVGGFRSADLDLELAGARSLLASAGIECRVIGDGSGLATDIQGTLGWVVREGTTNVLRHSEARGCTITLRPSSTGTVALTMDNDGATGGPPDNNRVRYGSGLIGLAERIAGLGGTISAQHQHPDRFCLVAELPLTLATSEASKA